MAARHQQIFRGTYHSHNLYIINNSSVIEPTDDYSPRRVIIICRLRKNPIGANFKCTGRMKSAANSELNS